MAGQQHQTTTVSRQAGTQSGTSAFPARVAIPTNREERRDRPETLYAATERVMTRWKAWTGSSLGFAMSRRMDGDGITASTGCSRPTQDRGSSSKRIGKSVSSRDSSARKSARSHPGLANSTSGST
ncbi:hypothetical protein U1Q18_001710 [Sarracenia purpurea var. burkii]